MVAIFLCKKATFESSNNTKLFKSYITVLEVDLMTFMLILITKYFKKIMAIKKIHTIAPKKSDAKKKMEPANSKTKSASSKQSNKKRRAELDDDDLI